MNTSLLAQGDLFAKWDGEISSDFFLERNDKKSTQKGETIQILPLVLDRQMGHKLMLVRKKLKNLNVTLA